MSRGGEEGKNFLGESEEDYLKGGKASSASSVISRGEDLSFCDTKKKKKKKKKKKRKKKKKNKKKGGEREEWRRRFRKYGGSGNMNQFRDKKR